MSAQQFEFTALTAAPAPRALTLDQLRDLVQRAQAELEDSGPAMKASLAALAIAAPQGRLSALAAVYNIADPDQRRLIRTLRALLQLLLDAEAHDARQPGKARAVAVPTRDALAVATSAVPPISISES